MPESQWTQQGATLSHKTACKEFGLTEDEIFKAVRAGKLQYRENYAHGNPYLKLLRSEVESLALELRGVKGLEAQKLVLQDFKGTYDPYKNNRLGPILPYTAISQFD
jgi:hypothetical protein